MKSFSKCYNNNNDKNESKLSSFEGDTKHLWDIFFIKFLKIFYLKDFGWHHKDFFQNGNE